MEGSCIDGDIISLIIFIICNDRFVEMDVQSECWDAEKRPWILVEIEILTNGARPRPPWPPASPPPVARRWAGGARRWAGDGRGLDGR